MGQLEFNCKTDVNIEVFFKKAFIFYNNFTRYFFGKSIISELWIINFIKGLQKIKINLKWEDFWSKIEQKQKKRKGLSKLEKLLKLPKYLLQKQFLFFLKAYKFSQLEVTFCETKNKQKKSYLSSTIWKVIKLWQKVDILKNFYDGESHSQKKVEHLEWSFLAKYLRDSSR